MKNWNESIIHASQDFAARWGFLTKDLFFEFFCQMSQAQQYRYWNYLVEKNLFLVSKANTQVLILSKKSRTQLGENARPARSPFYITHDSLVARFILPLIQRNLIERYWLEDELIRNPIDTYTVLGASRIHRIPDLVFDLRSVDGSSIRCALEIETVTKAQSRYAKIALAYADYSKVSLILFGCGYEATQRAVLNAFYKNGQSAQVIGVYKYQEFDATHLNSKIRFAGNELSMRELLEALTKKPILDSESLRERNEKPFSLITAENSEAA
ncbi:MAG: hypothetical protein JNL11_15065 [Bdellovibrionaceae bacterium]|nr:hypothetical protein [Pseudobdellovibrionaceae bacterium]